MTEDPADPQPQPTVPLLALAGPKGSGKTAVAELLELLGFHTLAYADPLKRLVRAIFDIPATILWGPSEGRDRTRVTFGDPADYLQQIATEERHPGGISEVLGPRAPEGRVAMVAKIQAWGASSKPVTVREVLQWVGTEWGRSFDPQLWINLTLRDAETLMCGEHRYSAVNGLRVPPRPPGIQPPWPRAPVAITDARYRNEGEAVTLKGGALWWLDDTKRNPRDPSDALQNHSSEPTAEVFKGLIFSSLDRNGPAFGGPDVRDIDPIHEALRAAFGHLFPKEEAPITLAGGLGLDTIVALDDMQRRVMESLRLPSDLFKPRGSR